MKIYAGHGRWKTPIADMPKILGFLETSTHLLPRIYFPLPHQS